MPGRYRHRSMFVKVCGTTSEEDALLAVAMGADAVGFIFAPSSRQVAVQRVAKIVDALPPDVETIGVFRNDPVEKVIGYVAKAGLSGAQLHGDETPADAAQIRPHVKRLIKVFSGHDPRVDRADAYDVDTVMLDAPKEGAGAGEPIDWTRIGDLTHRFEILLAGALTPDSVADAIRVVQPWGVDVASGVEASPGRKDPRKVKAFIDNARNA